MTTLIGEQPNQRALPATKKGADLPQPQDIISRNPISAQRAAPTFMPPNDSVDMDSQESSACYPRRTFYPLSDGPPHVGPPDRYDRLSSLLDPVETSMIIKEADHLLNGRSSSVPLPGRRMPSFAERGAK